LEVVVMKRIASKGSAVFLALLFVTFLAACNWEWLNPDGAETTDVVYEVSPDGKSSSLTLYFDGNGAAKGHEPRPGKDVSRIL
jgi:hypothetical protein